MFLKNKSWGAFDWEILKSEISNRTQNLKTDLVADFTNGPFYKKTLDRMTRTKVADQRFSLKQWFAGGVQSRGLRKPGCGHCHLRLRLELTLL